jgi:cytochrome c
VSEKNGVYLGSSLLGIVAVVVLIGLIYFGIIAQYQIGGSAGGSADVAENIKPIGSVTLAGDEPAAPAPQPEGEAAGAADPQALATSSGCLGCHQVDTKLVGPAYKDVAEKYKDDAGALDMLSAKVKSGGVGTWGEVPMPPNAHVSDEDIHTIVEWILSL